MLTPQPPHTPLHHPRHHTRHLVRAGHLCSSHLCRQRHPHPPLSRATVITLLSIPVYAVLFHTLDLTGLAIASDIGIFAQTASLAILLHRKKLASLSHLEYAELGRSLLAALVAYAATTAATRFPATPSPPTPKTPSP